MGWQVIGHDWVVSLLRQRLATGQVAHAYLFSGPPQIGKETLATALAQALNCTEPEAPCGHCRSCLRIARGLHPDVQVVIGEGVGESLKIDQVRTLHRQASLAPYEGRYRVFLIPRIDQATIEATNSMLKILEEPPAHVVLILTATHTEALPPTVVSRCQRFELKPVPLTTIEAALQQRGVPLPKTQLLARLSGGRIGWALAAIADEVILRQREEDLERLTRLLTADRVERFDLARQMSQDPAASRRQLDLWTSWWRDLLLLCAHRPDYVTHIDQIGELERFSAQCSDLQAWAALKALQVTATQLENRVNAQLAWESLLLKLPRFQPTLETQGEGVSRR
ncbi:MAG: DNA polymerase III subunit [Anaerolineae bacterium]